MTQRRLSILGSSPSADARDAAQVAAPATPSPLRAPRPAPQAVAQTKPKPDMPAGAWVFISLLSVGWAVGFGFAAGTLSPQDLFRLLPLVLLSAVVRRFHIGLYAAGTFMTVSVVGSLAAGMMLGFPGAIVCSTLVMVAAIKRPVRQNLVYTIFNAGSTGLSNGFAALAFVGMDRLIPGRDPITLVPGALLAALVTYTSESAFVSLIVSLTERRSPRRMWTENYQWMALYWLGFGLVALGLVVTYDATGIFGLAAFAGPALLMRYAMKQYLDRTTRSVRELSERNAELESANREIEDMSLTLKETYIGTLEALVAALDARDRETYGHSTRVSHLTMILAREMGLEEGTPEWIDMERGALLHDVGKIGVADAILRKPGALNDAEWVEMRNHARIGYEVLKDVPFLAGAAVIVAAHHERWDGRGYPRGLKGEEVPLGARIFMLADTFDAMATDRPYRKARPYQECLAEIVRCSGTQFDPTVVESLYRVYPQWVESHRQGLARAAAEELESATTAA